MRAYGNKEQSHHAVFGDFAGTYGAQQVLTFMAVI